MVLLKFFFVHDGCSMMVGNAFVNCSKSSWVIKSVS
jgi:hypothetical protein